MRRSSRDRAFALAVALLALLAAMGCESARTPDDAGPDALRDAGRDSGRDAGADAPRDAGPDGAPRDADPGWIPIPGYPEHCELAWASNPAAVFTPEWVPCAPAAPGCTWLAPDPRFVGRRFIGSTGRYHDGTTGYFLVSLELDPGLARLVRVAARSEGPPLGAIHRASTTGADGSGCSVSTGMTGPGVATRILELQDRPVATEEFLLHGDLRAPLYPAAAGLATPSAMVPSVSFSQGHAASDTTVAFAVQPGGWLVVYEDSRWARRGGPGGAVRGAPTEMTVHGRDVFWMSWSEGARGNEVWLVHATIDEVEHPLVVVPESKLWGLGVDDEYLCWIVEVDHGTGVRDGDLYCSPYATETADLAPRLVRAEVALPIAGTVGAGRFALPNFDPSTLTATLDVIDIADGTLRRFAAPRSDLPGGWRFWDVLWVTDTEVAATATIRGPAGGPNLDTLVRMPLSALELVP